MTVRLKKKKIDTFRANGLLPGEDADIVKEPENQIPDASTWLDTPNSRFGGDKPRDLIGTDRKWNLRNVLRAIKYGQFS
jgi:hypothetical protein